MMEIRLKCFADLAERFACGYQAHTVVKTENGATVGGVMRQSGIPEDDVKIVFVNGRMAGPDHLLYEGDRVTLVPATGGM
jgi:molybdopterin converting factor small subunit